MKIMQTVLERLRNSPKKAMEERKRQSDQEEECRREDCVLERERQHRREIDEARASLQHDLDELRLITRKGEQY